MSKLLSRIHTHRRGSPGSLGAALSLRLEARTAAKLALVTLLMLSAPMTLLGASAPGAAAAAGSSSLSGPANETLQVGQSLTSPNGAYTLRMQTDGNLVLTAGDAQWPAKPWVVWASGTDGKGGVRVTMQSDGNLVMYPADPRAPAVWFSNTQGAGSHLEVQNDGNLVIYFSNRGPWFTGTNRSTQCSHVYHKADVSFGGWATTGHDQMAADICYDGHHVWLQHRTTPSCWVDPGAFGTSAISACQINDYGTWIDIQADMSTHFTPTIGLGLIAINANLDTKVSMHDTIDQWGGDHHAYGTDSVPFLYVSYS
jgi:hypothetical protein